MQEKTLDNDKFPRTFDSFEARLEGLMQRDGYTQSSLARLVGTTQSTVQGWLGGAMPRRRTLTELATLFNVSVAWLESGGSSYVGHAAESPSVKVAEGSNEATGLAARFGVPSNKVLVDMIEMQIKLVIAGEVPVSNLITAGRLLQMIRENEDASIPR